MYNLSRKFIVLISVFLVVQSSDFKCPSIGTKNGKKVPNILTLIPSQNGYYSTIEVNTIDRENLVHEHYDIDRKVGFIDLEAMDQSYINRRYYYHDTNEKLAILKNGECRRMDLDRKESVESIKDWFEPANIVEKSEIFKDFVHLGPSVLMLYAHTIGDKASFVGTELIDGRSIDHWFYCINDAGPYIDFYFDTVTSYPYRFSLFYPAMEYSANGTVQIEINRHSDYVYNFFIFKPLVISPYEPIPYPVSYGCTRKNNKNKTVLPDFSGFGQISMDLEAVITYPSGEVIRSSARIMKHNDVYSYEINEEGQSVRSIENPPPLGRWEVDKHTGRCKYFTSDYHSDITLVTRWPFFKDRGFNLLYYIVSKPPPSKKPDYIGRIDLGPVRIEEYKANKMFNNQVDAIVDYYFTKLNNTSPLEPDKIISKILFTRDRQVDYLSDIPLTIEVTIVDLKKDFFDYEDRFDVSECYQDPGMYTWFQLVFPNSELIVNPYELYFRKSVKKFLTRFIPITRVSDIVINEFDSNIYVSIKLLDRIHFIEAYHETKNFELTNGERNIKRFRAEDCEEICSLNPACFKFSYCSDLTCSLYTDSNNFYSASKYNTNCTLYDYSYISTHPSEFMKENYLTPMRFVLDEIRRKIHEDLLVIPSISSSAVEMFIISGPEEIGDLSESNFKDSYHFLRDDDYPIISRGYKYPSGITTNFNIDYIECIRLCANDDNCDSFSHCPNQNNECILSSEREFSTLSKSIKAEGCNIYEKSFVSYFTKLPGKSLVSDAAEVKEGVSNNDCATECVKSKNFNCKSYDYCDRQLMKASVCFLHVNHLTSDPIHEVNATTLRYAEQGCDHYSKKSDYDYRHIVAYELAATTEVIGNYEEISLEHCASTCNSNPSPCYSFEYCEDIESTKKMIQTTLIKSKCRLSNARPKTISNTYDPEFTKYFTKSLDENKICSIYVNQEKIYKSISSINQLNVQKKDETGLAFGLGSFFFIIAFAGGVIGFIYAHKNNLIK